MVWTPELVAQLRQLYDEGLSYNQIALRFQDQGYDATRNAMVGKGHRIKLPPRREMTPEERHRRRQGQLLRRREKEATQRKQGKRRMNWHDTGEPKEIRMAPEAMDRKAGRSGLLIDLDHDQCRWPGEEIAPRTYLYCVEDSYPGKSYCPNHCNKAYGPNWIK